MLSVGGYPTELSVFVRVRARSKLGVSVVQHNDGNLVILKGGEWKWGSVQDGGYEPDDQKLNYMLSMQNDGDLVIKASDGSIKYSTCAQAGYPTTQLQEMVAYLPLMASAARLSSDLLGRT